MSEPSRPSGCGVSTICRLHAEVITRGRRASSGTIRRASGRCFWSRGRREGVALSPHRHHMRMHERRYLGATRTMMVFMGDFKLGTNPMTYVDNGELNVFDPHAIAAMDQAY